VRIGQAVMILKGPSEFRGYSLRVPGLGKGLGLLLGQGLDVRQHAHMDAMDNRI
jgi:hypothetical protein